MREGIDIIDRLLDGETVTLDGEVITIANAQMLVPSTKVPISVAANSPMTLRLAGEVGETR